MPEHRRASELRQAELVDAALHIIATRGITALGTRSLAEAVGLSSGAIFRHFASLDQLLEAVVTRVETTLESTLPPAELPPAERLARFLEARGEAVGDRLGIVRLMLSEQFLLALPPEGSARLQACVQRSRAFVALALRDGQREGVFRADLPVETLVPIVIGTVQVLALSTAGGRLGPEEARAARHSLLALLAAPASARG